MDDSVEISKLLHKSLLPKLDEIVASLDGIITPLQRTLLAQILDHISDLNRLIKALDRMAKAYMAEFQSAIAELCQMPGIAQRSAEVILAEAGIDMSRFPSAAHPCSWAGVCPDNHQSSEKRYYGKMWKEPGDHSRDPLHAHLHLPYPQEQCSIPRFGQKLFRWVPPRAQDPELSKTSARLWLGARVSTRCRLKYSKISARTSAVGRLVVP